MTNVRQAVKGLRALREEMVNAQGSSRSRTKKFWTRSERAVRIGASFTQGHSGLRIVHSFPAIIRIPMKARVYVFLKSTVLDPQGQTIKSALSGLGYRSISGVRQGKYFEIALDAGATREQAQKDIDTIARDVLTNPVIEEYRVEFLD